MSQKGLSLPHPVSKFTLTWFQKHSPRSKSISFFKQQDKTAAEQEVLTPLKKVSF